MWLLHCGKQENAENRKEAQSAYESAKSDVEEIEISLRVLENR